AEPLAKVPSSVLTAALGEPASPGDLAMGLFRPEDEEGLTGLTDIYEVVGRFSFQGDDDDNLARVQALVAMARNEIVAQPMRFAAWRAAPPRAWPPAKRRAPDRCAPRGPLPSSRSPNRCRPAPSRRWTPCARCRCPSLPTPTPPPRTIGASPRSSIRSIRRVCL